MTQLLDVEIEMHAFRLLRSGHFRKAEDLVKALEQDLTEIPRERLLVVCHRLAERLLKSY